MTRLLACALAVAAAGFVACRQSSGGAAQVRIAAASDLRFALDELVAGFRAEHAGLDVSVSYGSSGAFFSQLVNEAPFDLFLSADVEYPRELARRGLTRPGSEFAYAVGRLALWVPSASSIDVGGLGMRALDAPGVSRIAIANPEHAPYGRAAVSAMRAAGVHERVESALVYGENVSQALQFVQSGSAQIGIIALSLAVSPTVAQDGRFWEVPPELYPRIEQGGAILRWAADPDAARLLQQFLLGETGRAALERYGFLPPGG